MNLDSPVTRRIVEHWQTHAADAAPLKQRFLDSLRNVGTIRAACEVADIDSKTVYIWRAIDAEFREAMDYARHDVDDLVEQSLFRQATSDKSFLATIAWLKANRPKYRDRLTVDVAAMEREIEERLDAGTQLQPASSTPSLPAKALLTEMLTSSVTSDNHHE